MGSAKALVSYLKMPRIFPFTTTSRELANYLVIAVRCFSGGPGSKNDLKAGSLNLTTRITKPMNGLGFKKSFIVIK